MGASLGSTVLVGAIAWLALAGLLALEVWPHVPTTMVGSVLFVAIAAPAYVLAEWLPDALWSSSIGRFVSEYPSAPIRILLGIVLVGMVLVLEVSVRRLLVR